MRSGEKTGREGGADGFAGGGYDAQLYARVKLSLG
jgi:hypothetical protein